MSYYSLLHSQKLSVNNSRCVLCRNRLPVNVTAYSDVNKNSNCFTYPPSIRQNVAECQEYFVKRQIRLKTVRGFRHLFGLPVNGQRTHSNAGTRKRGFRHP